MSDYNIEALPYSVESVTKTVKIQWNQLSNF